MRGGGRWIGVGFASEARAIRVGTASTARGKRVRSMWEPRWIEKNPRWICAMET